MWNVFQDSQSAGVDPAVSRIAMAHKQQASASSSHQIWGEPEALSCYGSSSLDDSSSGQSGDGRVQNVKGGKKTLPLGVQQHVSANVVQQSESNSSQSRDSVNTSGAELPIPEECSNARSSRAKKNSKKSTQRPELMSVGAAFHDSGECKPCIYIKMSGGCRNGTGCQFCHLPHPKPNRRRPSKRTRARCREVIANFEEGPEDAEHISAIQKQLETEKMYMEKLLLGRQRDLRAQIDQLGLSAPPEEASDAAEPTSGTGASSSHQGGVQEGNSQPGNAQGRQHSRPRRDKRTSL